MVAFFDDFRCDRCASIPSMHACAWRHNDGGNCVKCLAEKQTCKWPLAFATQWEALVKPLDPSCLVHPSDGLFRLWVQGDPERPPDRGQRRRRESRRGGNRRGGTAGTSSSRPTPLSVPSSNLTTPISASTSLSAALDLPLTLPPPPLSSPQILQGWIAFFESEIAQMQRVHDAAVARRRDMIAVLQRGLRDPSREEAPAGSGESGDVEQESGKSDGEESSSSSGEEGESSDEEEEE
ncbi:hypothetical protein NLI96_g13037 [Meripilus lineatus]|uniref:Uncharacterized protein n=1 Tax=Meripilus lineatus TaxID=2056292 RepID=A0AAD5UQJ5_9APHY|nr:hypothetical protein NLI96_g13037 [Physisporinus lineatus]